MDENLDLILSELAPTIMAGIVIIGALLVAATGVWFAIRLVNRRGDPRYARRPREVPCLA